MTDDAKPAVEPLTGAAAAHNEKMQDLAAKGVETLLASRSTDD